MMNIVEIFAVPNLVEELNYDLKGMTKYVKNYAKKNKSQKRSTLGGYQSDNLYYKPGPIINKFVNQLANPVKMFSTQLRLKQPIQLSNLWFNINKPGDSNLTHSHAQAIISGIYYIQAPKKSGDLVFQSPAAELMDSYLPISYANSFDRYNCSAWSVAPKAGVLLLFPSWIRHHVKINESKQERISVSFNYSFQ